MGFFGGIDTERNTAIYIRISTAMQQTDRQREELLAFASSNGLNISDDDIYTDIISGFKDGEVRPQYSVLKRKVDEGIYKQILFSEFSRLDRKPSNLLKSIEYYQSKDVHLYFKKQGLWVKDKADISTQIMISILAVMSQYEIELFTARGIDGKVTAIKNRGINQGGLTAYGYTTNENKILAVDETEAEIVRRIFAYYLQGKSTLEIVDILNNEGVPAPYKTRIEEAKNRRKQKGLPDKEYRTDYDNLKWRASTISRLIKNELYIGKRDFTFYEPEPSNPLPTNKRENRKVLHQFNKLQPELAIIDEDTFYQVNKIIEDKKYNKNLGIRHNNLLKELLICGECGSNYSVTGNTNDRKYKCYGSVKRIDKPRTCFEGTEVQMVRLDGLVLQLCLYTFADYDLETESNKKIQEIDEQIKELNESIENNELQIKKASDFYSAKIDKIISLIADKDKDEANAQITKALADKKEKVTALSSFNDKAKKTITHLNLRKSSLMKMMEMKRNKSLGTRQHEIMNDRNLVKEYISQFVENITIYKMSKLWSLVIVHLIDGGEFWGSVKTARYKKEEMFYDETFCSCPEYKSWCLNNSEHCFSYNKEDKSITFNGESEIYTKSFNKIPPLTIGTYTPEQFDEELKRTGWIGSFPPYQFEIK
jgi:DNA invertase Pin-like site-specific DNA recombinase